MHNQSPSKDKDLDEIIRPYQKDMAALPPEKLAEICEVVDAFLNDYRITGWNAEEMGYGS